MLGEATHQRKGGSKQREKRSCRFLDRNAERKPRATTEGGQVTAHKKERSEKRRELGRHPWRGRVRPAPLNLRQERVRNLNGLTSQ